MRKMGRRVLFCLVLAATVWCAGLLADREKLNEELIRLHVVAASDSAEDQNIKLQVRDAVLAGLQQSMRDITDVEAAKTYLQENLPKVTQLANEALHAAGYNGEAVVTFCKETFDKRIYDTFTLPAGIYESLRIVIGEGEGKNWWCVVFPGLCMPKTEEKFEDVAVSAGFSDSLTNTLSKNEGYEVRFFLLECLGRIQNFFFAG